MISKTTLNQEEDGKMMEENFFVRFFAYGVSGKGRGGFFASWEDREKFQQYFPEARNWIEDPDIRICGYSPNSKWEGSLPADGETWQCEFVRVTNGGLVLLKLLNNETKRQELEYRDKVFSQAVGLDLFLDYVGDMEVAENRLDEMMIRAILYILELKKFAEEEVAKKGKLPLIREMLKNKDWQLFNFGNDDFFDYLPTGELAVVYDKYSADKFIGAEKSLKAIISWLERDENVTEIVNIGKREFRCGSCNYSFRLGKKAYQALKVSGFVVRCPNCGANSG